MINDLKQNYSTDNIDTIGKRFIDILQAGIDGLLPIYCFILSTRRTHDDTNFIDFD